MLFTYPGPAPGLGSLRNKKLETCLGHPELLAPFPLSVRTPYGYNLYMLRCSIQFWLLYNNIVHIIIPIWIITHRPITPTNIPVVVKINMAVECISLFKWRHRVKCVCDFITSQIGICPFESGTSKVRIPLGWSGILGFITRFSIKYFITVCCQKYCNM